MNKNFEIKLLSCLGDPNDQVVSLDLEVLAVLSVVSEDNFVKVLSLLMRLFQSEQTLLNKAGYIIRQLSIMLNPENIFRVFARILLSEEIETIEEFGKPKMNHLEFNSIMVQTLNTILLTGKELLDLRNLIKRGTQSQESKDLFVILYKSWCHNPVSTLCLCLLAGAYRHASALVARL
jgi:vacuole morphology and inheritance protein 14